VNLISVDELREPMRVSVKIRHRHEPAPAVLEKIATTRFLSPSINRSAPSLPGQAAVFYDDDIVVGGWLGSSINLELRSEWAPRARPQLGHKRHRDSQRHFHKAMRSHDPRGALVRDQ
jgi:hypothetical protein